MPACSPSSYYMEILNKKNKTGHVLKNTKHNNCTTDNAIVKVTT